jgi:hypothetical protein
VAAPVVLRLIGVLDKTLIADFDALEREISARTPGLTLLVDVTGLSPLAHDDLAALGHIVRRARIAGRDVRLIADTLPWKRVVKRDLPNQPEVDGALRGSARRMVILAHNGKRRRR